MELIHNIGMKRKSYKMKKEDKSQFMLKNQL